VLAALGGQDVLCTAIGDIEPDPLFAGVVGARGVDQVDAQVEDRVQHLSGHLLRGAFDLTALPQAPVAADL
jgi:hypothetical protein